MGILLQNSQKFSATKILDYMVINNYHPPITSNHRNNNLYLVYKRRILSHPALLIHYIHQTKAAIT